MQQKKQRIVFGNINMPPQDQVLGPNDDPDYLHNTLVFELAANWPWVRWMMDRFRNKELNQVDMMERDWLNFILQNDIDVEKYGKDSDQFIDDWFKNKELTNE